MNLALQHRPRKMADLVGQEIPKKVLASHIRANTFSPGYLFEGMTGSGKTSAAYLFSRRLLCKNPQGPDACLECESCRMVDGECHPNLLYVDATSQRSIEDVKTIMIRHLEAAPVDGTYRILIVDEVHQMTRISLSPFLTLLETMPKRSIALFCTTEKVMETVRDRCTPLVFHPLPAEELGVITARQFDGDPVLFTKLARACGGSFRRLWSVLEIWQTLKEPLTEELIWKLVGSVSQTERHLFWQELSTRKLTAAVKRWRSWLKQGVQAAVIGRHLLDDLVEMACAEPEHPLWPEALTLLAGVQRLDHPESWLPALLALSGIPAPPIEEEAIVIQDQLKEEAEKVSLDPVELGVWLYG